MDKRKISLGLLVLILAGSLLVGNYHLQRKSGYYVDEGMTLFLANGIYNGAVTSRSDVGLLDWVSDYVIKENFTSTVKNVFSMLSDVMNAGNYSQEGNVEWYDTARSLIQGNSVWVSGQDLYGQITASGQGRFQYIQVYINQAMDVHPPLYYWIVHTVFSLFAGSYKDVYLYGINVVFLVITCILLYRIGMRFWGKEEIALFAVAIYAFSQGYYSCALYFRMYAIETCAVMLALYLHLLMKEKMWKLTRKDKLALIFSVLLGCMTHYYYIMFLIPLFCVTGYKLLVYGHKTEFWPYFRTMALSAILYLVMWPFSLYHILFGYRGTEAISNLNLNGMPQKLLTGIQVVKKALAINSSLVMVLVIILVIGYLLLVYKERKGQERQKEALLRANWQEIVIPAVIYGLVVIKVAPLVSDRYIMCLFPIAALAVSILLYRVSSFSGKAANRRSAVIMSVTGCAYILFSLLLTTPDYLYPEQSGLALGVKTPKAEMNCLMVADDDYRGFPEVLKLAAFNQVMVIGVNDLYILQEEAPEDEERDIVVYVWNGLDQEEMMNDITSLLHRDEGGIDEVSSDIYDFSAYIL